MTAPVAPTRGPAEALPDPAPFAVFFLPNFVGILLALLLEYLDAEAVLKSELASTSSGAAHPYALLGVGIFVMANTASYLSGSVSISRIKYNVKLPNLYADKGSNKDAVLFNCVQRGHQNFLENHSQYAVSTFFVAIIADRPHVAGAMLVILSSLRYMFAVGYRSDNIKYRFPPFLLSTFVGAIGTGYAALVGLSAIGVGPYAADAK